MDNVANGAPPVTPPVVPSVTTPEGRRARAMAALAVAQAAPAAPVVTPPVAETPKAVEPPPVVTPPKEASLAPQVEALRTREASITTKEAELTTKEQTIAEREAALTQYKTQPLKLLETLGMTFQELADAALEEAKTPAATKIAIKNLQDELGTVKKTLETKDQETARLAEEAKFKEVDRKIEAFKTRVSEEVAKAAETYPLVSSMEVPGLVFDIIQEYFTAHGEMLPVDKAMQAAETYLEDKVKKALGTKKFKPTENAPKTSENPQTLTNNTISGSPTTSNNGALLTQAQRFARAAGMIKFD